MDLPAKVRVYLTSGQLRGKREDSRHAEVISQNYDLSLRLEALRNTQNPSKIQMDALVFSSRRK
jgi:hypothetical protein